MFFKKKTTDLELLPPPAPEGVESPVESSGKSVHFSSILEEAEKPKKKIKGKKAKAGRKNNHRESGSSESQMVIPDSNTISAIPEVPNIEGLEDSRNEIQQAIESLKSKGKPSVFGSIFRKKETEKEEMPQYQAPIPADRMSEVRNGIAGVREALMSFDTEAARRIYKDTLNAYNQLSHEDQAKVYKDVKEVYFERKSAEQFRQR